MYFIREVEFIKVSENEYFMLNLINGAADMIDKKLYEKIIDYDFEKIDSTTTIMLLERKYLYNSKEEYKEFISDINTKIELLENESTPNFLIIPTYACNLSCIYCYEQTYMIKGTSEKKPNELINIQFDRIDRIVEDFRDKTKRISDDIRITIMGGEPLLKCNINTIEYIFSMAKERGYSVDIVTNGVDLNNYMDLFINYKETLKHIQITIDGVKDIHDKRRVFHDGKGSFDMIMKNVEIALQNNILVYLRVNVDGSNINELPKLANTLKEKFGNNENLQDGGCSGEANIMNEKIGIERIFELEDMNPNMAIFYKKFHPAEFINSIFNDSPYQPVLRHCAASKNQFIMDCKANVYKCWHGIGNNNYRVGTYDPCYNIDKEKEKTWKNRSTSKLLKCLDCKYRYICGTGCPAATHKKDTDMNVKAPSCVDYKQLIKTIVLEKLKRM